VNEFSHPPRTRGSTGSLEKDSGARDTALSLSSFRRLPYRRGFRPTIRSLSRGAAYRRAI
jgi:hypothetical protein